MCMSILYSSPPDRINGMYGINLVLLIVDFVRSSFRVLLSMIDRSPLKRDVQSVMVVPNGELVVGELK